MSVLGYKSVLVDTRWKLCFQAVQGCVGHNYSCSTRLIKKKQGELATSIKLEYNVELGDAETLRLTFKIGQTRMYVLNNIGEFYEAYKNESELCYGKQLRFIPKRENFVEESKEIFDYIITTIRNTCTYIN